MSADAPRLYREWLPGPWVRALPNDFISAMTSVVVEEAAGRFNAGQEASGLADYCRARNIFGRMEEAQRDVMPWLLSAIPDFNEKNVLEIGCGTGSATVPLAMAGRHVWAFDLSESAVEVARKRCTILRCDNVILSTRGKDWIDRFGENPVDLCPAADVIFCYAAFEHLLPIERLKLLLGSWKHLPIGGYLVIVETPNRLWWFDWHSTLLPFADQVPSEIGYLWNGFSGRDVLPKEITANSLAEAQSRDEERLYRFGRGASFHEFYVALGPGAFEVVEGEIPHPLLRDKVPTWNDGYIATLAQQLGNVSPPVHRAFARPCLDLVIRKTGAARLSAEFG
jgi:2-polyprenyl-3-methyl-5-hydroxy-6-metoxy-1,4-benzoquinol methylase